MPEKKLSVRWVEFSLHKNNFWGVSKQPNQVNSLEFQCLVYT